MISNDPGNEGDEYSDSGIANEAKKRKYSDASTNKARSAEAKKKHALYSRKNYYKTKASLDELRASSYDQRAQNIELHAEFQRLQGLLACANNIVAQINHQQPPVAAALHHQHQPQLPNGFAATANARTGSMQTLPLHAGFSSPNSNNMPPTKPEAAGDLQASKIVHQMLLSIQQLGLLQQHNNSAVAEAISSQQTMPAAGAQLPSNSTLSESLHIPSSSSVVANDPSLPTNEVLLNAIPNLASPSPDKENPSLNQSSFHRNNSRKFTLTAPLDLSILVPLLSENSDGANDATMGRLLQTLSTMKHEESSKTNNDEKRIAEDILPAPSASNELVEINVSIEELKEYLVCLTAVIRNLRQQRRQQDDASDA